MGAFVRCAMGAALDPTVLSAFVREHLAPFKTPRHWVAVNEFPMTGSGKIQKFVLRDRFLAGNYNAV